MSDLSDFTNEAHRECRIAALDLTDEQRAQLNEAMERTEISTYTIWHTLTGKKWGKKISQGSVAKHRRQGCTCYE